MWKGVKNLYQPEIETALDPGTKISPLVVPILGKLRALPAVPFGAPSTVLPLEGVVCSGGLPDETGQFWG